MDGCLKLPLKEEQLEDLVNEAKDYLLSHGKYVYKTIAVKHILRSMCMHFCVSVCMYVCL